MDRSDWDPDDGNQVIDGEAQEFSHFGREGLIFVIDATKPMFEKTEDEPSPFKISLECCKTTMQNKIISSKKDLIGVILLGTSKTSNELNVKNITVLQDLEQPSAGKIKQLEAMLNSDDFDDFDNAYGHCDDYALSDVLWLCQTLFSKCQVKLHSEQILLFTNNDNPHRDSVDNQHKARNKAKDLGDFGIDIELLHIGTGFNPNLFYKDLIQVASGNDSDDWRLPNPSNRFDELLARVCRKDYKRRTYGRVYFELGEGVKMGIAIYNLVRRTPVATSTITKLEKKTNKEVKSSTKRFEANTGAVVLPTEIHRYMEFGFRKIIFTDDEVKSLKKITKLGLKLLGFKPSSSIKMHHHCHPSSFIYPAEELVAGSRKLFAALLDRCIAKNVVPICCFTPRATSFPSLVALLPQEEKLDESNIQILPPGFHVVYLPYADDIRNLNIESTVKAEPEQIEVAKKVIKKLRFKYSPYSFDNPKLQTHWSNIEALALEHERPREVKDVTVPDYEYMKEKLGYLSLEFLEQVYPPDYDPVVASKSKAAAPKKRAIEGKSERPIKMPKKEEGSDTNMRELAEQHKVETLKVPDLKAFLQSEGIKVTGLKKGELVAKVYEHLGIPQPD